MNKLSLILMGALLATPAMAEEAAEPFFSLHSTEFVVTVAFVLFLLILVYFKVGNVLGGLLDKRAEGIKADLDAARKLRDEAKAVLASYEAKHKEVQGQADLIVAQAKREAEAAAEQAKLDLTASIARRVAAAEDQIKSAETSAVRAIRDRAVTIAVAAAGDLMAAQMGAKEKGNLIDAAIGDVEAKLH